MAHLAPPIQFVLMVSGWLHRQQSEVIDYPLIENGVLRGQIPGRVKLTDKERALLGESLVKERIDE